jgi:ERF superfamily
MKKTSNGNKHQLALSQPSVALMLQGLLSSIQNGQTTPQTVEVLKGMMDLYERTEARQAEKDFNAAFVELQKAIPEIKADKAVPDGKGGVLYSYCSFEEIYRQVKDPMMSNGFSVRFSQREENGRITETCHLMHISGHSVSNDFTARVGAGARGMNETKCDLSASSIAQRESFCDALNIPRVGRDDDAKMMGSPIGRAIAEEFQKRVKETGCDEQAFLKYAGVSDAANPATIEDYMKIRDTADDENYNRLDEALKRKEKQNNSKKANGEKRNAAGEFEWGKA